MSNFVRSIMILLKRCSKIDGSTRNQKDSFSGELNVSLRLRIFWKFLERTYPTGGNIGIFPVFSVLCLQFYCSKETTLMKRNYRKFLLENCHWKKMTNFDSSRMILMPRELLKIVRFSGELKVSLSFHIFRNSTLKEPTEVNIRTHCFQCLCFLLKCVTI